MIWQADIDRWWHNQTKFSINILGTRKDRMFVLRDKQNKINVNIFDDEFEAREFAFQMVHRVLTPESQDAMTPIKMQCRMMLHRWETDISSQLGLPDNDARKNDMLGMMLAMVQDALDPEKGIA